MTLSLEIGHPRLARALHLTGHKKTHSPVDPPQPQCVLPATLTDKDPTMRTRPLLTVLSTLALSTALSSTALADRVSVSGGVTVSGGISIGGGIRVSPPRRVVRPVVRPVYRPVVRPSASLHVGVGYYRTYASPPPADCNCDVPSQYYAAQPYYQTYGYAAPAPVLPRWGLGLMAGGVNVEGEPEGEEFGLLGRYRLSPSLQLEGELAEATLADDARRDRRAGAGLIWELSPHASWSLQAVGEIGATQARFANGDVAAAQAFGELGLGARFKLTERIHLSADIRAGSRETMGDDVVSGANARVAPPVDETEEYTRGRITGVVFF